MGSSDRPFKKLSDEVKANRKAYFPINPLFLNRWSPRSYLDKKVSDQDLYTVLEAARWAPSASNEQPWRFIVAKTDKQLNTFYQFIMERNRLWCEKAPILILLASQTISENGKPNGCHAFDTGAAWASLAFQAKLLGLSTRAMAGFDKEKSRQLLNLPETLALHAVIALGYQGEKMDLADEKFREMEQPNQRRPLYQSVFEEKSK